MVIKYSKSKIDCEHLLGKFLDESHYDEIIDYDCDFFDKSGCSSFCTKSCENCDSLIDENNVIFVLRKNFFTQEDQHILLSSLKVGATKTDNRGLSTGYYDSDYLGNRKIVKKYHEEIMRLLSEPEVDFDAIKIQLENKEKYDSTRFKVWKYGICAETNFDFNEKVLDYVNLSHKERLDIIQDLRKNYISSESYSKLVFSGILGSMDRSARIPYGRITTETLRKYDIVKESFPVLSKLSEAFKNLLPNRYNYQKTACEKIDSRFVIPGTVFTTLTVNKSYRTAAHRDFGDLHQGFSNLTVLSEGKNYAGGKLILPEYRLAINIRPGDLLLINNHFGIHGNDEIVVGDDKSERYSLVCYFREGMLKLGSYEYESCRKDFTNQNKTEYKKFGKSKSWSGTYPGMWESKEWYDFLEKSLGKETLLKYHPKSALSSKINLMELCDE